MLLPILSCDDIRASIEFYELLGFAEKWCLTDDNDLPTFASVEFHGGTIDFVEEEKRDVRGIGIQLYVEVPETISIETMYDTAEHNQLDITKALENRPWGEKVFVINDIDGYNLMFAQKSET